MDIIFSPLIDVIRMALGLYKLALLIYVIMGLLEQFEIINRYNTIVYNISSFLFRIMDPALSRIRQFSPFVGNVDLSPLILFFMIVFLDMVLATIKMKFV